MESGRRWEKVRKGKHGILNISKLGELRWSVCVFVCVHTSILVVCTRELSVHCYLPRSPLPFILHLSGRCAWLDWCTQISQGYPLELYAETNQVKLEWVSGVLSRNQFIKKKKTLLIMTIVLFFCVMFYVFKSIFNGSITCYIKYILKLIK